MYLDQLTDDEQRLYSLRMITVECLTHVASKAETTDNGRAARASYAIQNSHHVRDGVFLAISRQSFGVLASTMASHVLYQLKRNDQSRTLLPARVCWEMLTQRITLYPAFVKGSIWPRHIPEAEL